MGSSAIALNRSTCGLSKKKNDYKHFSVAIKHELAERCDLNFTISKWRTETVQFKLLRDLGRLKTLQIIMILKRIVLRTACGCTISSACSCSLSFSNFSLIEEGCAVVDEIFVWWTGKHHLLCLQQN